MPDVYPLPVSEETRESLRDVRGEDQSYDELLQQLVEEHYRLELTHTFCDVEERDAAELPTVDEVCPTDDV